MGLMEEYLILKSEHTGLEAAITPNMIDGCFTCLHISYLYIQAGKADCMYFSHYLLFLNVLFLNMSTSNVCVKIMQFWPLYKPHTSIM